MIVADGCYIGVPLYHDKYQKTGPVKQLEDIFRHDLGSGCWISFGRSREGGNYMGSINSMIFKSARVGTVFFLFSARMYV